MPILSGSTNAAGGALITIPAGEVWQGSLAVSLGSDATSLVVIQVQGGGTGVSPAANTNLVGTCVNPATLNVAQNQASISDVYVQAGDAAATLNLVYFGGGTPNIYGSATGGY